MILARLPQSPLHDITYQDCLLARESGFLWCWHGLVGTPGYKNPFCFLKLPAFIPLNDSPALAQAYLTLYDAVQFAITPMRPEAQETGAPEEVGTTEHVGGSRGVKLHGSKFQIGMMP